MSLSFTYLLLWSICGTMNLSPQMSLQCLSTNNMVFSDVDKILIKSLYLKKYTAKRLTDKFPENSWTKHSVNKLLKKLRDTGTVDIATKHNHTATGSFQSPPHFTKKISMPLLNILNILLTHKYTQHTHLHA